MEGSKIANISETAERIKKTDMVFQPLSFLTIDGRTNALTPPIPEILNKNLAELKLLTHSAVFPSLMVSETAKKIKLMLHMKPLLIRL